MNSQSGSGALRRQWGSGSMGLSSVRGRRGMWLQASKVLHRRFRDASGHSDSIDIRRYMGCGHARPQAKKTRVLGGESGSRPLGVKQRSTVPRTFISALQGGCAAPTPEVLAMIGMAPPMIGHFLNKFGIRRRLLKHSVHDAMPGACFIAPICPLM